MDRLECRVIADTELNTLGPRVPDSRSNIGMRGSGCRVSGYQDGVAGHGEALPPRVGRAIFWRREKWREQVAVRGGVLRHCCSFHTPSTRHPANLDAIPGIWSEKKCGGTGDAEEHRARNRYSRSDPPPLALNPQPKNLHPYTYNPEPQTITPNPNSF